jgi:hypothetical protein
MSAFRDTVACSLIEIGRRLKNATFHEVLTAAIILGEISSSGGGEY